MYVLRYLTLALALAISVLRVSAQATLRTLWETCPDFRSEQKDLVLNALDSLEQIQLPHHLYEGLELMQADSLTLGLRDTALSTWSMRLLPLVNGTSLIAVIRTVEKPVADSRVDFYTTDWKPLLGKDLLALPTAQDWAGLSTEKSQRLSALLYPLYMSFRWLPKAGIEMKVSTPTLLNDASRKEDEQLIEQLPPIVLHWDGARFVHK